MKSNKLFLLILCIGLIIPFQVDGQTPWETNGNITGLNDFLGTTNNQVLNFKTNNTFRMRLMNTTGYLGVGSQTFTPSASLHLNLLSYNINSGNLIRTDGRSNLNLSWAMYSGTNVGNSVQKARFLLSPFTATQSDDHDTGMFNDAINHLQVESTLGDIVFQAHGANGSSGNGELTERMRVTSALFTDPHWGAQSVSTTRVSISARPKRAIEEPLAMLHIGEPWDFQRGGHREWMNSGVYVNRSNDNVFFGMRPRENTTNTDANDAIIAWGDNDSPPGREDGLRIVFSGPFSAGANPGEGAHLNGLETMRFHPLGNIGMGDFSVNGLNQMPTEKLDIVGRLRVRDVPIIENPDVLMVGQEIDSEGDYVLNHISFPDDNTQVLSGTGEWISISNTGGVDCRWEDINSATIAGEQDMRMGFDPSADCYRGKLGLGVQINKDAKLEVHNYWDRDQVRMAIYGRSRGDDDYDPNFIYGVVGNALGTYLQPDKDRSNTYVGVRGMASEGGFTVGVLGSASGSTNDINNYSIGVYASASGPSNNPTIGTYTEGQIALMTFGAVTTTQSPLQLSDESVKTEIQSLSEATIILNQLQPKSYTLVNPEGRDLKFEADLQFGFLAQEVEEILPNLVEDFYIPNVIDSTGFVENTSLTLKGIQYVEMIPLLVAGFQEQNTTVTDQEAQIASQNETIATLEAELEAQASQLEEMQNDMNSVLVAVQTMQQKTANCCTPKTNKGETGVLINENLKELELEQNVPNPFDDQTRIAFNLPRTADVILEITDATGRPLERLIDGKMSGGEHTTLWDGSKVASGIYFYTLYADGELITKKMIKQ